MSNDSTSGGSQPQAVPAPEQGQAQEQATSLHGILSEGSLPLPDGVPVADAGFDAGFDATALAGAETVILKVEELLVSHGDGTSLEGGFLVFDSDSSPGNTVVRVVLDGAETPQVFEFGTFQGAEMDLNSLLGLAGPDATNPV